MRDMFSFAGWSFIGNLGFSVRDQGLNIILNMFFNVAVNAAKGVSNQIGGVLSGFAGNFQMALNPQITKRYASGDLSSMMQLVLSGCKYSALLMIFIVVPLFFAAEEVLYLWLGSVAPYTVGFLRLVLIMALIDSMVSPVTTALQAIGRIKWFQIIVSVIMLSNLPVAWLWLKFNHDPYVVMFVSIITSLIALGARLVLLRREIKFSYKEFAVEMFGRVMPSFVFSVAAAWGIYSVLPGSMGGLIAFILLSVMVVAAALFSLGLGRNERHLVWEAVKRKLPYSN